ncbi:cytochrome C assembly protein [Bacillus sp. FJAT-42376]|uniref:cytochrome c biogenesis protein n=1 Tax=Bacillus sp. FJAT-42376 TaxID=2014076 RepID=UPI000F4DD0D0|nr:cytochrome c biogenesis protein [Bacillus sp. FJAT-42376]AZB43831.1 cytochrome C assembly protein [Bacillus sp. FJAT-42376]
MMGLDLNRLNEAAVIIYACCVLFYFIDFVNTNRKASRIAFWLLSIVWLLQTIFLFYEMAVYGTFPILNIVEGLYFYTWVLVTLSLVLNWFQKADFIPFFTSMLGFIMLALNTFAFSQNQPGQLSDQLISELSIIHITMAILSYGAFTLSFVFSMLYLLQYRLLKKKQWGRRLIRIHDLSTLDHMAYLLNVTGVPMLLLSLILGSIWAYIKLPDFQWYDPKVTGSFAVILVYSMYLYIKIVKDRQGKPIALWNAAAFLVLLINFFLFGSLSRFHVYS